MAVSLVLQALQFDQLAILLLFISSVAGFILWYKRGESQLNRPVPPGPRGLELVRILPDLLDPFKLTKYLAHKYGKIVSFRFGGQDVVFLNDIDTIRDAFISPDIADRPTLFDDEFPGQGIVGASGEEWRERRKFILTQLRKFDLGKDGSENRVREEAVYLIDAIKGTQQAFNPYPIVSNAVMNVVSVVIIGKRFDYDDLEFRNMHKDMDDFLHLNDSFLRILPKFVIKNVMRGRWNKMVGILARLQDRFESTINEHDKDRDCDHVKDMIDSYLKQMSTGDKAFLKTARIDIETLKADIADLLMAGSETSSVSLAWVLLYMATYPDVQHKAQCDIDKGIGKDVIPSDSDRFKLPFIEAILWETARIQTIVPFVPHTASRDSTIQGYHIAKGSMVTSNVWGVHTDPHLWEEPDQFKPQRFLDSAGNLVVPKHLIPFSVGRRSCIGEKIAKLELFIFFTHMLQKFTFTLPDEGSPPPSFKGILGLTYAPEPFKLCAQARN
ncbi:cytochrome P450 2U1-like [Amphiura filiformis]|uniref:cytochrome P450 2U1-like n=1 Tax=Amphiura filiformis TaxID=82378 RepID=UPI003B21A6FF